MATTRLRRLAIASTLVLATAACGDGGEADEAPAGTGMSEPSPTGTTEPNEPAPIATTPAEPEPTTEATPTPTTPTTTEPDPAEPPAAGEAGTATVEADGARYEFRVIQCLRDRPSAFGDTVIEFTLDAVPVDTPPELVEPLLGEIDPDTDLLPLVEPVAEFGPLLSVSRFEDGGDYVVVYDLAALELASDPDPLATDARFLDVPDGDAVTVSGSTTAGGTPLTLTATCP